MGNYSVTTNELQMNIGTERNYYKIFSKEVRTTNVFAYLIFFRTVLSVFVRSFRE